MHFRASKGLDEPAHARSLISASAFLAVFSIVDRYSMGCVLMYLSMFSCFNQTDMRGNKRRKTCLINCPDKASINK